MPSIKTLAQREEKEVRFTPGHTLCAGCAEPMVVRTVLNAIADPVVVASPTGCLEVASSRFPGTAWNVPWIHVAFENAGAVISGVEAAYKALRRTGAIRRRIRFVVFAGDGGTYDIGLQALSGALERGHDFLYVCLNNEAYMNTGVQRSSATPACAAATTAPVGDAIPGKPQDRKDLTEIVAAHHVPYVAQAAVSHLIDLANKVERAMKHEGPKFLNVLTTCPLGWRTPRDSALVQSKLAVETRYWPLYEVVEGKYKINYKPKERVPVEEWLKTQGRFRHLFRDPKGQERIAEFQAAVDRHWEYLLRKETCFSGGEGGQG
ncbi:MAG: thiamine pyrophosphate-dependent enzyme [Candidatus Bipolaricaulota bacterium]|nr:thiamine pyrophosphate-dependent enzyme [Candidatus Bipolaricaulota bacterium]